MMICVPLNHVLQFPPPAGTVDRNAFFMSKMSVDGSLSEKNHFRCFAETVPFHVLKRTDTEPRLENIRFTGSGIRRASDDGILNRP